MRILRDLLANNKAWAEGITEKEPDFFDRLSQQQSPEYLWIGCADSRVPANQIVGLQPGNVFVHRNVANVVVHSDMNCLSVIEYAVAILKVRHIIVCGHYGCGSPTVTTAGSPSGIAATANAIAVSRMAVMGSSILTRPTINTTTAITTTNKAICMPRQ